MKEKKEKEKLSDDLNFVLVIVSPATFVSACTCADLGYRSACSPQ